MALSFQDFDIGEIIPATIKEVRDYGVIVELAPEVTVLLHNSEISQETVSGNGREFS